MADNKRNAVVLGVTGGIACGKSEAGRILREMGFAVHDADRVAHDLMKKGTPVYRQIVDRFGTRILSDDGEISRPILGATVLENPAELDALNRLVHPVVRKELENWIAEKRQKNKNAALLVPLLFESGMDTLDCDAIICVSSREQQVLDRLKQRGLSGTEAQLLIDSQMPLEEKERRSGHVVPNLGTVEELEQATREAVNRIRTERGL